jgi:putative molybdopterin biosynthesis protein
MAVRETVVARARIVRRLTQVELARRAGISRQALGAIESGVYQPSVTVALRLARELGETVENLFGNENAEAASQINVGWSRDESLPQTGRRPRVALGRVGGKLVAVEQPAAQLGFTASAGMVRQAAHHRADVSTFLSKDEIDSTLLIAGCDPAAAILTNWLARRRVPVCAVAVQCSSTRALGTLVAGQVHAAGVHLRDPKSGEYNLMQVRRMLGRRRAIVVNFASWELGLATAAGNLRKIRNAGDLARPGLKIVNREPGSGARLALDEALADLGLAADRIAGYRTELAGHLEVAAAIAAGQADAGVAIRVAAEVYGLGFIPMREERYDLVIPVQELASPIVKSMLDALSSQRFAREIGDFCLYETGRMGQVIANLN